jgi:signal transduction histidine kinase
MELSRRNGNGMSVLRIVGLCICAASVLTAVVGIWFLKARVEKVRSWRPVDARVVASSLAVESGTDSSEVVAKYELHYTVNGVSYQPKFQNWAPSMREAEARMARHAAGSTATVHYNPADPRQVDPNLGMNSATLSMAVWLIGGGVAGVLFGAMFAILGGLGRNPGDLW